MRNDNITRLTLAGMFAALAFVCFTYLRIEIPMGCLLYTSDAADD